MKNFQILCVFILLQSVFAYSQVDITLNKIEESDFYLLGTTKDALLIIINNKKDSKTGAITPSTIGYYDKTTMQQKKKLNLPKLNTEHGIIEKNYYVSSNLYGDTLLNIYFFESKEQKKNIYYGWIFNVNTLEPLEPFAQMLTEQVDDPKRCMRLVYQPDSDTKTTTTLSTIENENKNGMVLNAKEFNQALELVTEKTLSINGARCGQGIREFFFTSKNDFLGLVAIAKEKNKALGLDEPVGYLIITSAENDPQFSVTELKAPSGELLTCALKQTKNGNLFAFCNYVSLKENGEKDIELGTIVFKIDVEQSSYEIIDKQVVDPAQYVHIVNTKKPKLSTYMFQLKFLSPENIVEHENGSISIVSATKYILSGSNTATKHVSNSIHVTNVSDDGKINYQRIIKRFAISTMPTVSHTDAFSINNRLILLHNDDTDNVEAFWKAWGKNGTMVDIRKTAQYEMTRPISNSAFVNTRVFSGTNGIYRITELDENGGITEKFINPKQIIGDSKSHVMNVKSNILTPEGEFYFTFLRPFVGIFENSGIGRIKL